MTNLMAYLIAIISFFRKQLLILLVIILAAGYLVHFGREKKIIGETSPPVPSQYAETFQPNVAGVDPIGRRYDSLEELKAAERSSGYLPIGYFGDNWPAVVSEVISDRDSIEFFREDGVRQRYSGFDGYDLKVVRLKKQGNKETVVVFRSVGKR